MNVIDDIPYLIVVTSNVELNISLYTLNMNEQENVQLLQEGSTYRYLCCFETGINYLRVENTSSIINANPTITITSHDGHYLNYEMVDDSEHNVICECGHEAVLEHSYEYKAIDSTYHILTCKCGATSGSSSKHLWTAASEGNVVKCKTCSRTKILAPGEMIPIIKTKPIIIEEETE